jgi:hypothetical protein
MKNIKGWGPFRCEWYSICSAHSICRDDCSRCQAGHWVNCWVHEIESYIHDHYYPLWFWWANRSQYSFREGIKRGREYKNAR